ASDKLRLFALLSTSNNVQIKTENIFGQDSEIVFAALYRQNQLATFKTFTDKKYLETYGLETNFFEQTLSQARPIPFAEILKNSEFFWNASIEGGTPLIGFGRNVIIEDSKGRPSEHLAVISYIKPDNILKALNFIKLSEISIVDQSGNVLVHADYNLMKSIFNVKNTPLFKTALESKVSVSVASLKDQAGEFLGAYAKGYRNKIYVLARASKDQAFSAVYQLVTRSISFALIVVTLSLFFAFLLSRSLTEPISILVEGMEKVSRGDLSSQIKVKSNDETQMLASSFNQMIIDLKQSRDELQEINRELDQKVKDRTLQLEIQNQAVKEAQEALLKTTRLAAAGEIAGRAAHEVLNPLTGILTRLSAIEKKVQAQFAPQVNLMKDIFQSWRDDHQNGGMDLLVQSWQKKSEVDPAWTLWTEDMHNLAHVQLSFTELMKTIELDTQFLLQESRRISKIIGGMRSLSRLHSDVKQYSAKRLLIDCRNVMADLFNQAQIELKEDFYQGSDEVDIDRDEFIQAVTNLMRNSLQALEENKSQPNRFLKIATVVEKNNLCIYLSDNGSGVAEIHQKMLFEKQFTTKSAEEGTGLGLGISRRFIRAHGGDIEFVSSQLKTETIFKIKLPLKAKAGSNLKVGAA
ncbi:MAG: HAMP domain-containing protein, partial [Bdellovibrionaceae bacterium]|nr:HAMP domain-containing protein [Bdellovibrio sp.]